MQPPEAVMPLPAMRPGDSRLGRPGIGAPDGNRTRIPGLEGRCPDRWTTDAQQKTAGGVFGSRLRRSMVLLYHGFLALGYHLSKSPNCSATSRINSPFHRFAVARETFSLIAAPSRV